MFPFKYPRTSQPQGAVGIDWSNPITRGLISVCDANSALGTDLVSSKYAVASGAATKSVTKIGNGFSGTMRLTGPTLTTTSDFTVVVVGVTPASLSALKVCASSGNLWMGYSTSLAAIAVSNSTGDTFAGAFVSSSKFVLSTVRRGATLYGYLNGILGGSSGSVPTTSGAFTVMDYSSGGFQWTGSVSLAFALNRALSDAEIKSISDNPWQIFAPITRPIWIPATTVVSISRPTADVTTTGWTGTPDNTDLFTNIDETVASDTSYITSPTITGGESIIFGLSGSLVAGTWDVRYRANFAGASADVKITLLDGSNVSQGASSWQTVTSSYADYTASVTTTGTATRVKIEVQ